MRRTGAVLVMIDGLVLIIGMYAVGSSAPTGAILVGLFIGGIQIFCGIKGITEDESRLWGGIALGITILMMLFIGMMVFQLILGLVGSILLFFPRNKDDEKV